MIEGEPTTFEDLADIVQEGKFDREEAQKLRQQAERFEVDLESVSARVVKIRRRSQRAVRRLLQQEALRVLRDAVADIRRTWPATDRWLEALERDAADRAMDFEEKPELAERYRVNVLLSREPGSEPPVLVENVPTVQNLLGSIDPAPNEGASPAPHLGIHAGAMLRADGGTLILIARDVLSEPMAWTALIRTLRTGEIELSPQESAQSTVRAPGVKPEPIPVRVKVVLVGEPNVWYALDESDPDFSHLFKVLVDFDEVVPRDATGIASYGRVGDTRGIARDEKLLPFTSAAVGALVEFGAREAAHAGKLTARFARVADLRAGVGLPREGPRGRVRRPGRRGPRNLHRPPPRGSARTEVPGGRGPGADPDPAPGARRSGSSTGSRSWRLGPSPTASRRGSPPPSGPGTPARSTSSGRPSSRARYTKGFLIARGLMRHLLRTDHPLSFDASITHEQSYGGIDGDSASGAEFCCLLSALTGIPVRQGVAMTGAIDQHGNVLPIGAANEKIEGFFNVCAVTGLEAGNGVIVPIANVGDLQLRKDVVHACRAGKFAVWGVARNRGRDRAPVRRGGRHARRRRALPAGHRARSGGGPRRRAVGRGGGVAGHPRLALTIETHKASIAARSGAFGTTYFFSRTSVSRAASSCSAQATSAS